MRKNNEEELMPNSKGRTLLVFLLMLLFGTACFCMMVKLAITEGSIALGVGEQCLDLTDPQNSDVIPSDSLFKCYVKANELRPVRGEIYDDRGRLLVGNYAVFEVAFDGPHFVEEYKDTLKTNPHTFDNLVDELSKQFYAHFKDRYPKYDENHYREVFQSAIKTGKYKTLFFVNEWREKTWVTGLDTAFINNLECLKCLVCKNHKYSWVFNYVPTNVRINPYGEIARRTLGMNNEGKRFGLEYTMDSVLAGQEGSRKYLQMNKTNVPLKDRIEPVDGMNIHTTLNLEIQNAVHNELAQKLTELKAKWGCVIVMETATGEIKAITNLQATDSSCTKFSESMEYALNAKVEPGSTFKLASLLAYFEKGGKEEATYPMFVHTFEFPTKSGGVRKYYKVDSKVHGETFGTPNEIFQRSSNIGIASMIFNAYGIKKFESYRKQLEKFGFFDTIHTQLGDLMPATIRSDSKFDNYYAVCFGAGFHIPILRTLMYYNAIANNGKMMAPLFVKYITNNIDTVKVFEPEVINPQFASPLTVAKARQYLDSVVWGKYGTGRHYRDSTCMFAGKTGTRDLWDAKTRSWIYDRNAVSFCGYFPKDDPTYTMIIYIYDVPQHSEVAVDAFRRVARAIMNYTKYSAMKSVEDFPYQRFFSKQPINRSYFNTLISSFGYDTLAYSSSAKYWTFDSKDTSSTLVKPVEVKLKKINKMPDVRGMIASDAISELASAGYKVTIVGRGIVIDQVYDKERKLVRLRLGMPSD